MNGSDKNDFIGGESATETGFGLGSFVMRTALKTLVVFLVIFSLAATLVGCLFPKTYMNMYRSLGLYGKAAAYAAAAAERSRPTHGENCDGSCEYSSLLTDGISIASISFEQDGSQAHAERLYEFTDAYLSVGCHEKRSERNDAMYLKVYGERGLANVSVLYGYDDYICGERFRTMLYLYSADGASELLERSLSADISTANAEVLNMLSAYFNYTPSKDAQTVQWTLQYSYFYTAAKFARLRNIYFGYRGLAASIDAVTLAQKAQKASLLFRLWGLAADLDKVESNFALNTANADAEDELAALIREDVFGDTETASVRDMYFETVNGKTAAA